MELILEYLGRAMDKKASDVSARIVSAVRSRQSFERLAFRCLTGNRWKFPTRL